MIEYIENTEAKRDITRTILGGLSTWFGLEDSVNEYVDRVADCTFYVFKDEAGTILGFYALKPTSDVVLEIYVCGVLENHHNQGVGKRLFKEATEFAKADGFKYIQVKTVQSGHYESYDKTNLYYKSLGFDEFEVMPNLWDEHNPCQIYIYAL